MRQTLIMGNWKLNGSLVQNLHLAEQIVKGIADNAKGIAVCPPFTHLAALHQALKQTPLLLGAQNIADQPSGAYTGEINAAMLKEAGCTYSLVGHSERRTCYGDSNESVAERFYQAQQGGITPVLCIGETLQERTSNATFAVLDAQLAAVINKNGIAALADSVIAYEPVWAIGTGKTATAQQAQEAHHYIRQQLAAQNQAVADKVQILYGGSVKPDNAMDIFAMDDIDGGLIGGASLDPQSFLTIYQST